MYHNTEKNKQTSPHIISGYTSLPERNMQNLLQKVWFESIKLFCRSIKLFCYYYLKQKQIFGYYNVVKYFYPACLDLYTSLNITGVLNK